MENEKKRVCPCGNPGCVEQTPYTPEFARREKAKLAEELKGMKDPNLTLDYLRQEMSDDDYPDHNAFQQLDASCKAGNLPDEWREKIDNNLLWAAKDGLAKDQRIADLEALHRAEFAHLNEMEAEKVEQFLKFTALGAERDALKADNKRLHAANNAWQQSLAEVENRLITQATEAERLRAQTKLLSAAVTYAMTSSTVVDSEDPGCFFCQVDDGDDHSDNCDGKQALDGKGGE